MTMASLLTKLQQLWQIKRVGVVAAAVLLFIWTARVLHGSVQPVFTVAEITWTAPVANVSTLELVEPVSSTNRSITTTDRPLVLYAFFETPAALLNLEFFIKHALHDAADFIFVLNGETTAESLLPPRDNIRFIKHTNDCYDLGTFASILTQDDLYKKYNRYILMNASIRGPFMPTWSNQCWSDAYLDKLSEDTKLVGMSMNCEAPVPHIQSMLWALDRVGLETLLYPSDTVVENLKASLPPLGEYEPVPEMHSPGITSCPHKYWDAVAVEVYSTALLEAAGYGVDAIMSAYSGFGDALARGDKVNIGRWNESIPRTGSGYESICKETKDPLFEGQYWGTTIHPFDTLFAKTNRKTNMATIDRLSQWMDGRAYSSYDVCK